MVAQLDASLASLQVQLMRVACWHRSMPWWHVAWLTKALWSTQEPSLLAGRNRFARSLGGRSPDFVSQLNRDQTHKLTIRGQARQGKVTAVLPELDTTTRTQTVVMQLIQDPSSPHDDLFFTGANRTAFI